MSYFYLLFQHFVSWLLNPGRMIDGALAFLSSIFAFCASLLGKGDVAYAINNAMSRFASGGEFSKTVGLAAYFFSPIVDSTVFLACLDALLLMWILCTLIGLGFMIKGWISGTGAS